jgi:hypothetical protein
MKRWSVHIDKIADNVYELTVIGEGLAMLNATTYSTMEEVLDAMNLVLSMNLAQAGA